MIEKLMIAVIEMLMFLVIVLLVLLFLISFLLSLYAYAIKFSSHIRSFE